MSTKLGEQPQEQQQPPRKTLIEALGFPVALLTLAAIASPISQATLAPVFGAIPSAVNHKEAVIATSSLGFLLRYLFKNIKPGLVAQFTPVWAFWMPVIQCYLFRFSGSLGIVGGPVLIGFLSCHTIIIPAVYAAAEALESPDFKARFGPYLATFGPAALGLYHLVTVERWFQAIFLDLTTVSSVLTPPYLQLILASTFAFFAPSKLCLLAVPALFHTLNVNPHFDSTPTLNVLNRALETHNWTILDRRWSNTGYLSVLEDQVTQYRVLRCDHSLLGGEWLLTDERRQQEGWRMNEPIYAVFELLEAVRLMKIDPVIQDADAQALVVGLGVGTAPKAFISHGINTTVVELDPVVHEYATKYFGLPANHNPIVADAVQWVEETASNASSHYDHIIHDVFTGGAEPLALFTQEFLTNLRSLLKPNGAIAINYAGDLNVPLTTKVLITINKAFDGQCKIYRDTPADSEVAGDKASVNEDFTNMVIFCRNAPGPIAFRKPTKADFLGSKSREHYLSPDPKLEIPFPLLDPPRMPGATHEQALKSGEEESWSQQQAESATKHWHVMRRVVPDAVWELW